MKTNTKLMLFMLLLYILLSTVVSSSSVETGEYYINVSKSDFGVGNIANIPWGITLNMSKIGIGNYSYVQYGVPVSSFTYGTSCAILASVTGPSNMTTCVPWYLCTITLYVIGNGTITITYHENVYTDTIYGLAIYTIGLLPAWDDNVITVNGACNATILFPLLNSTEFEKFETGLDSNGLYILFKVIVENTSLPAINETYYIIYNNATVKTGVTPPNGTVKYYVQNMGTYCVKLEHNGEKCTKVEVTFPGVGTAPQLNTTIKGSSPNIYTVQGLLTTFLLLALFIMQYRQVGLPYSMISIGTFLVLYADAYNMNLMGVGGAVMLGIGFYILLYRSS